MNKNPPESRKIHWHVTAVSAEVSGDFVYGCYGLYRVSHPERCRDSGTYIADFRVSETYCCRLAVPVCIASAGSDEAGIRLCSSI